MRPLHPRPITELLRIEQTGDYRWAGPTSKCLCGNELFGLLATFEDGEIAMYFTDGLCVICGVLVRLPTEGDDDVV